MAYKRGGPLMNFSAAFRLLSAFILYVIVIPLTRLLCAFMYSLSYRGKNKLTEFEGNAVLVSNHTTALDPTMIAGIVFPALTYHTLLEATVRAKFLGTFIRLLGGIPIPPGINGLNRLVDTAKKAFSYRKFIHFYPEGECYIYNQNIKQYKFGAFYASAKLGAPVIPVVTVISERLFKSAFYFAPRLPRITLVVLDPVKPEKFVRYGAEGEIEIDSVKDFANAVQNIMQGEIDALRSRDRRFGTQAYYKGTMKRIKGVNDN